MMTKKGGSQQTAAEFVEGDFVTPYRTSLGKSLGIQALAKAVGVELTPSVARGPVSLVMVFGEAGAARRNL